MKIYTKTGDTGETALFGGKRVKKNHLRVSAYGAVDELNSQLGVCVSVLAENECFADLTQQVFRIQNELFNIGAELATPAESIERLKEKAAKSAKSEENLIGPQHIEALEKAIDAFEKELQPLQSFILPGGALAASMLHLARTICRRVERDVLTLHEFESLRRETIQYFNRLSDYLFVVARVANARLKIPDIKWSL